MGIIMKKLISSLLILTMLLTSFTLVFADANTVTLSIADDSYIKLGSTITATFGTAITEAVAKAGITVTKIGDETNTNLVDSVSVNGTTVTISFGDKLEYSSHYKLTVSASTGIAADNVIYFSTYNKMFRGISNMLIEENFNGTEVGSLPAYASNKKTIGKFEPTVVSDDAKLEVNTTEDVYGRTSKALYAVSTKINSIDTDKQKITIEAWNGRVAGKANGKLVISFKFKAPTGRLKNLELHTLAADNATRKISEFYFDSSSTTKPQVTFLHGVGKIADPNRTAKSLDKEEETTWHEYTIEFETTETDAKCVYAAIDGEPVPSTQNISGLTSFTHTANMKTLYLNLAEYTEGKTSAVYIDDIKVYVPEAYVATTATSEVVAGSVNEESAKVKIAFTNPVDKTTLANIGVTPAGGEKVLPATTVVSNDLKTATLTFNGLAAGTEYTVNVPAGVKDVFANSVTGTDVKFTTTAVGGVEVSAPVISGTSTPGSAVSASASYDANKTGKPVSVTMMLALYEGIQLVELRTVTETIAANAPAGAVTADLTIPSREKHGIYSAKAFVWDSVTGMNNLVTASN